MKTSYFGKHKAANGVSIARGTPKWFHGRTYGPLMPTWDIINLYKKEGNVEEYTRRYKEEILGKLDPATVYRELGEDAVILCHCGEGFCHRHLVAEWLSTNLGVEIEEYEQADWRRV